MRTLLNVTNIFKNTLRPIFKSLRSYQAPICIYKVCSTFDSSENIGNIGQAIELGTEYFSPPIVPVLPAAPIFGRYTVFGNHFASVGNHEIYRLDRHPSISKHPVTPMKEADFLLHLTKQTHLKSGLINILEVKAGSKKINKKMDALITADSAIAFFDCLSSKNVYDICKTIFKRFYGNAPIFIVGSQELGYGFANAIAQQGIPFGDGPPLKRGSLINSEKGPILVVSGSCATVSGEQIKWACQNGFADVSINTCDLLGADKKTSERKRVMRLAVDNLVSGRPVVLHTPIGPGDGRIIATRDRANSLNLSETNANETLGTELGEITRKVIAGSPVRRIVVEGGDTAGRIQKVLRIEALQISKPVGIGAPLCYVYSKRAVVNGLEMAFKGGQAGDYDYFLKVQKAASPEFRAIASGNKSSQKKNVHMRRKCQISMN